MMEKPARSTAVSYRAVAMSQSTSKRPAGFRARVCVSSVVQGRRGAKDTFRSSSPCIRSTGERHVLTDANGDVLNGRVLGLDDKQLRLESATLGQVNIPRVKVVSITLGDQKPVAPGTPKAGAGLTAEAVLKQLQL